MKTSKEYLNNIKNGIITSSMLEDALYSVNKRAKNYRDSRRKYYGKYFENADSKMSEMYSRKEKLLSILNPVCIHSEIRYKRVRVYDYEKRYEKEYVKRHMLGQVVHYGSYMEVSFFDYIDRNNCDYNYYLYYVLGEHSFHQPIKKEDLIKYSLEIKEISGLNTYGDNCANLMSVQFVDKIIGLIETGNYEYIKDKEDVFKTYDNESAYHSESDCLSAIHFVRQAVINSAISKYADSFDINSIDISSVRIKNKKNKDRIRIKVKKESFDFKTSDDLINYVKENYNENMSYTEFVEMIRDSGLIPGLKRYAISVNTSTKLSTYLNENIGCLDKALISCFGEIPEHLEQYLPDLADRS
ncbi:MAG: hypothetical protein ACI4WM_07910 [Erysipelotrichaceae bacterium]